LFEEVVPLADKVVVFHSWLDRILEDTRFDVAAQRVNAGISTLLLREAAPELAKVARQEQVDAIFPVSVPYTRLLPNAIAWIPDLQHCFLPEFFSSLAKRARDRGFPALLHDPNRHVVFSSQSALDDAIRAYGAPRAKIHVLHFTTVPLPEWFQDPAPIVARYGIPVPFFIVCNQFWIHKDHITAFTALAKLKQQGLKVHLVCTGPTQDNRHPEFFPKLKSQIKSLGVEEQIHILGMIPRIDQVCLMRASMAVLQPSRFEGWSTVIEDARALGKPVIASDFPVHVEQQAPRSSFFKMGDADDCALAISRFLARSGNESREVPAAPPPTHEALIVEFARAFVGIVEASLRRSPLARTDYALPPDSASPQWEKEPPG
jgi:glycosyltransferase involved in cell wall biosynthesis